MNVTTFAASAAALLIGSIVFAAPNAQANQLVAADQKPSGTVIAQDQSTLIEAIPTGPRAVTVTAAPSTRVQLRAAGQRPQSKVTNGNGQARFTKLNPGTRYSVTAAGKTTTVVPVVKVRSTSDLTVLTTDRVDTVEITWEYPAHRNQGTVGFTLTATPLGSRGEIITAEASSNPTLLTGLDPTVVYSFSVTPHNALGDGRASTARMTRSLAEITGLPLPSSDSKDPAPSETHALPTPQSAQPAAPQPASPSRPAPAPQPSTRTIWVCPDGFSELAGTCTKTRDYTYTESTESTPYTYSQIFHQTGWQNGSFSPAPCTFGTYHANGPQGEGCYVAAGPTGYYTTTKDAPPMGWADNGSEYTRTLSTKDATPAGYSDNGTAWVRTAEKIAKVVPV